MKIPVIAFIPYCPISTLMSGQEMFSIGALVAI
jgi:hypothetical protein